MNPVPGYAAWCLAGLLLCAALLVLRRPAQHKQGGAKQQPSQTPGRVSGHGVHVAPSSSFTRRSR